MHLHIMWLDYFGNISPYWNIEGFVFLLSRFVHPAHYPKGFLKG